jgi:hypothetical protein
MKFFIKGLVCPDSALASFSWLPEKELSNQLNFAVKNSGFRWRWKWSEEYKPEIANPSRQA